MSHRRIFIAYLLASILFACADSDGGTEQTSLMSGSRDPKIAAESVLSQALTLNSAVSSAFGRVKADLEADPFVLFDEIHRSLQQGRLPNDHLVDLAAEEILEQMQMTEEDLLAANVYAVVRRFAELISLPRESIPVQRLADFLDDSIDYKSEMWAILSDDRPDRRKTAYYFAPAYNVVASIHVFGLAAAGCKRSTVEPTYLDAIDTNLHLVGTGEAGDPGYLSDWVASQTAGSASSRVKIDRDPIIYSIRRALEEQQRALE